MSIVAQSIMADVEATPPDVLLKAAIAIVFRCTECGRCCQRLPEVSEGECMVLSRANHVTMKKFKKEYKDAVPCRMRKIVSDVEGNICTVRDACTVYEKRPLKCRMFPFDFSKEEIELPSECEGVQAFMKGLAVFVENNREEVEAFADNPILDLMLYIHYQGIVKNERIAAKLCKQVGVKQGFEIEPNFRRTVLLYVGSKLDTDSFK